MNDLGGKKAKDIHKPRPKITTSNKTKSFAPKDLNLKIDPAQPSQMRKDYINDYYVLVAAKRHARPRDTVEHFCPFYETIDSPKLDKQKEVYSIVDAGGNWITKVVNNKFPSLTLDNPHAYGKQEIVIDTPLSNVALGDLNKKQLIDVVLTYQQRAQELSKIKGIKYVLVFKNHGIEAGASLAHSHTQIFALPMIPPEFQNELSNVKNYIKTHNTNPYDQIIRYEKKQKVRLISENKNFISICPYASRWPMEAWIVNQQDQSNIKDFRHSEINDLVELLHPIISKLTQYNISYNFYLHNGIEGSQRFILKLQTRNISIWGGFEIATGMIINHVPPESATQWYKDYIV